MQLFFSSFFKSVKVSVFKYFLFVFNYLRFVLLGYFFELSFTCFSACMFMNFSYWSCYWFAMELLLSFCVFTSVVVFGKSNRILRVNRFHNGMISEIKLNKSRQRTNQQLQFSYFPSFFVYRVKFIAFNAGPTASAAFG